MEDEQAWLAERFEAKRGHLRAVAYRMLGSPSEAEDAVQEALATPQPIRYERSREPRRLVDDSRRARLPGHAAFAKVAAGGVPGRAGGRSGRGPRGWDQSGGWSSPGRHRRSRDAPGTRFAGTRRTRRVVLHDMFDFSFDEIAPIVGRSAVAARQLASRARRRVQGATTVSDVDRDHQRRLVDAFLAASRGGDLSALLALLDPEVVLRADHAAVQASASRQAEGAPRLQAEVRGATVVADTFSGRARAAQLALLNGAAGAVWAPGGQPRVAFAFTIARGKIIAIEMIADPEHLRRLDVVVL